MFLHSNLKTGMSLDKPVLKATLVINVFCQQADPLQVVRSEKHVNTHDICVSQYNQKMCCLLCL